MKSRFILLCLTCCFSVRLGAQGFINLNFEDAQVVLNDPNFGLMDWNLAVPGWSHSEGEDTQWVYYKSVHFAATQAYLLVDDQSPEWGTSRPLEGDYSLYMQSGYFSAHGDGTEYVNAFIAQTGMLPSDSLSFQFSAEGNFRVLLDDIDIPIFDLGGGVYGGDISGFAGTIRELKIMENSRPFQESTQKSLVVDNIVFSPLAVPEPGTIPLVCLGTLAMIATIKKGRLSQ